MTIQICFNNDFKSLSLDSVINITLDDKNGYSEKIDINQKVVVPTDGATRFLVFYLPKSSFTSIACKELINYYDEAVVKSNNLECRMGMQGDISIGIHTVVYSKKIYLYTEDEITEGDLKILNGIAIEKGLYLTFRNREYLKMKMETDKPLAFISHDSRDKKLIARPLAHGLSSRLCSVWYDEFSLNIGDSLRESIEKGIKEAKKCILILTPNFLNNPGWGKKEFDSIFTREMIYEEKIILPIWYGVTKKEIYEYSPALADTLALVWPNETELNKDDYEKEVELAISKIHTVISKSN
ncbi:toll/interleukin-1 receptor domain-containing protein [Flavobacterium sp.]|uniref:toll/interleukin-1 receptor domain-containing protein n=1 Tax=Flavobacterium sp. TaxID=239 RepID=UPI003D10026C